MKIRLFDASDFDQSIELRKYVFRSPYTAAKAADYELLLRMADGIGSFDEGNNLLGQILNLPLVYNLYGDTIPVVGVNHVGILPENRGLGLASELMLASIKQARSRGQLLSILQPFSVQFYRQFGFDLFTERIHFSIQQDCFPAFNKTGLFKINRFAAGSLTEQSMHDVHELYDKVARSHNGMQVRDQVWWDRIHLQNPNLIYALFVDNNKCVAYVSYVINDTQLEIIDFIFQDNTQRHEIWNFISSHKSNIFKISGVSTSAKMINYDFVDPRIDQNIWFNTMIRIIDLHEILNRLVKIFHCSDSFSFNVIDKAAMWNTGTYQVEKEAVKFSPKSAESIINKIDIQEIAAIFFGPMNSDQLVEFLDVRSRPYLQSLLNLAKSKTMAHFLAEF